MKLTEGELDNWCPAGRAYEDCVCVYGGLHLDQCKHIDIKRESIVMQQRANSCMLGTHSGYLELLCFAVITHIVI